MLLAYALVRCYANTGTWLKCDLLICPNQIAHKATEAQAKSCPIMKWLFSLALSSNRIPFPVQPLIHSYSTYGRLKFKGTFLVSSLSRHLYCWNIELITGAVVDWIIFWCVPLSSSGELFTRKLRQQFMLANMLNCWHLFLSLHHPALHSSVV